MRAVRRAGGRRRATGAIVAPLLALAVAAGCAASSGAGASSRPDPAVAGDSPPGPRGEAGAGITERRIPPALLPPPGGCRTWTPSADPAVAATTGPVGRCSELRETIPAGSWLIYRPADDAAAVRVWQFGEDREVRSQRIYDAATGEIIRVVAPLGS